MPSAERTASTVPLVVELLGYHPFDPNYVVPAEYRKDLPKEHRRKDRTKVVSTNLQPLQTLIKEWANPEEQKVDVSVYTDAPFLHTTAEAEETKPTRIATDGEISGVGRRWTDEKGGPWIDRYDFVEGVPATYIAWMVEGEKPGTRRVAIQTVLSANEFEIAAGQNVGNITFHTRPLFEVRDNQEVSYAREKGLPILPFQQRQTQTSKKAA